MHIFFLIGIRNSRNFTGQDKLVLDDSKINAPKRIFKAPNRENDAFPNKFNIVFIFLIKVYPIFIKILLCST